VTRGSLDQRSDFRSLVDHLDGVAIWIVSEPGTFDYISDGFEEIWGIPTGAVKTDPSRLIETIHPDDRDRVRSNIEGSGEAASEDSYEARVVRPDGTVRWVQTRQFPLHDSEGNLLNVVGVSTDITEQRRREQELAALNRILRHDIRNDMGIILGWMELLQEHVDEEGMEYLEKVLISGEHIVELTEIARDYAETVTGEDEVDVKPISLRSTLQRELDLRRESFPEAAFRVAGDIPDVDVMANEMLSSVFRNLLNNAVQHNDNDEPLVEISVEARDDAVIIRIADNGPGIPDEQKASIFEKGEKGIESSGTGMGLYLVWMLVTQYGGEVRIEDNTPTGCVFVVHLPRAT